MKRIWTILLILIAVLPAQGIWLKSSERQIERHIWVLCSERFEGRAPQTAGDTLAASYLRHYLASCPGLRLMGEGGVQYFTRLGRNGSVSSFNVVGFIEGNDSLLRNEVIVVGAHYDHLGFRNGNFGPEVYYGADDNASGVALVMELAAHLAQNRQDLKRSVCIVFFGAEEQGLVGSGYFCDNLPFGDRKVVCMLNFDMVGHLSNRQGLMVVGTGSGAMLDQFVRNVPVELGEVGIRYRKPVGMSSDHQSFYKKGIPVLMFSTGVHRDYHTPEDLPNGINFPGMVSICGYISDILYGLVVDGVQIN